MSFLKLRRTEAEATDMGLRIGVPVFALALVADLASKAVVVAAHAHVYYHAVDAELSRRVLMSGAAVAGAALLTKLAAYRGFGRPWGAWIGTPLLVAGVLANGLSVLLWSRGVPDFITTGDWIGNLADFEIFFGIVGGTVALIAGFCLAYARELPRRADQRPEAKTTRSEA